MTLNHQFRLCPACGDHGRALVGGFEFVACRHDQLAQVVGAVIGQGMALEPRPQILDRIEVGRIRGWPEEGLHMTV
jgi:hypothetical protein